MAEVARARGVNANQVFKWRREFAGGELVEPAVRSTALLPVNRTPQAGRAIGPSWTALIRGTALLCRVLRAGARIEPVVNFTL